MEPDIYSYIVCSNISTECTTINVTKAGSDSSDLRQYTFLNLRAYINFTVTAVNIVGDGESTSIVYEPCEERYHDQSLLAVVFFDSENIPSLSVEVMVSLPQAAFLYVHGSVITLESIYHLHSSIQCESNTALDFEM